MIDLPRTVYDDATQALESGDVDLLTCDVFDTLVWRPVAEPFHLFRLMGTELRKREMLPDHVTDDAFLGWRGIAEHRARAEAQRLHAAAECTLEEIWDRLPDNWRLDEIARYADVEIEVERTHLRSILAGCELLRVARDHGIGVVLVSDTYLSSSQVTSLLGDAGVPLDCVDAIVTSSEKRQNKSTGLLTTVMQAQGVDPTRTLHVGDNLDADIAAGETAGARTVWVEVESPKWPTTPMGLALSDMSRQIGTDGGARGITRALRLADGADDPDARAAHGAAYDFGVTVGGPVLTCFADWLVQRSADLGVGQIHYLLREGAFLADVVAATGGATPQARLVHASRWVSTRAAVFDGTVEEIERALARRARFRPAHVTEAFGIDPDIVRAVVGEHELDDARRRVAIEALVDNDHTREQIVEASANLRRRLMGLYERELEPDNGRLLLCDIGWGGSIQSAITDLLDREGWNVEIFGLYFMLSQPGLDRGWLGARMEGFLPSDHPYHLRSLAVLRTAEISEQLCTPDRGTFVDIDESGTAVLAPHTPDSSSSRRRAQQGVLDYASARPVDLATPHGLMARFASALLEGYAGTIDRPDRRTAQELGQWEHDDVAGTGSEPLVDAEFTQVLRFANAARTGFVTMRDLYWLQGSAALASHSLSAEIAAVDLGIDAEQLCPASELGVALIAVFQEGDLDAVAQTRLDPHRNAEGWSLMRLTASASAVRDIRFDVGETDALVELGMLSVTVGDQRLGVTDLFDSRLTWHDAYPLSETRFVVRDGGYFTVSFAREGAEHLRDGVVDVLFAFRGSALAADEWEHFPPSIRQRVEQGSRRVLRRIRRGAPEAPRRLLSTIENRWKGPRSRRSPMFSIVLPTYNSPSNHLTTQLRSISRQEFADFECIIVDDASPDHSVVELVRTWVRRDQRLKLVARAENGGIAAATNEGIAASTGEFVVFCDHDDILHVDALRMIAEHLEDHPDDDVVYTDEQMIADDGSHIADYRKPDFSPQRLLGQNYMCHTVVVRRSLLDRVGSVDATFEPCQDNDLNFRTTSAARSVGHVPHILYSWRAVAGSMASSSVAKDGVNDAVVGAAAAQLARLGEEGEVVRIAEPTCVNIDRPIPDGMSVGRVQIDRSTTSAEVLDAARALDTDLVVLDPEWAPLDDAQLAPLVALAARHDVAAVGPKLVTESGVLVSAGRAHSPVVHDIGDGLRHDDGGPWGCFYVARECASVAPFGAVTGRDRLIGSDGLRTDVGLDLAFAEYCTRARLAGLSTLWTPRAAVAVERVLDTVARELRAADESVVAGRLPEVHDDPYSLTGVLTSSSR